MATADILPTVAVAASVPVAAVTITWADGTVTTVYPPETPVRPAGATPRQLAARVSSRVPDMARNAVEKESRPPPSGGRLSVLGEADNQSRSFTFTVPWNASGQ